MASDIHRNLLPFSLPPPCPRLTPDDSRHTSDELRSPQIASNDADDDRIVACVTSTLGIQSGSPHLATNTDGTNKDVSPEAPTVTPATSTTHKTQATTPSPTRRIYNFLCSALTEMARARKRVQAKSTRAKQAKRDPDYDPSKEDHRDEEEEYRYGANLMKIEAEHLGKYLHETISGPRRGKKSLELQIPVKIEEQDEGVTYPTPPADKDTTSLSIQTTVSKRPLDADAISPAIKRLKLEVSHESILSSLQDTPAPELRFDYRHNALAESAAAGNPSTPTTNSSRAGSPLRTQSTPGSLSPELSPDGDGVDIAMDDTPSSPNLSPVARVGFVVDEEQSPAVNPGSLEDFAVDDKRPKPSRSRRQSRGKSQGKSRRRTRTYSPSTDERFDSPSDSENDESLDEFEMYRIKPQEKTGIVFDFSSERAARWATAINLPEGLYNSEEQDLFFRLAMRGFEPLVPQLWRHDFPTLPESLYPPTSAPSFRPLFQVRRSSNLYATKALANLFNVGGRVRDCDILGQRPEKVIKAAIKQYFRWALFDADLHTTDDSIPVYAVYAQRKGETTLQAVRRLNRRLRYLTSKYHKALGLTQGPTQTEAPVQTEDQDPMQIAEPEPEPQEQIHDSIETPRSFPLLMGFIICGPIVAIVTHSTDPQEAEASFDGKFISQFDLSERGQDVWNSLAIAIAVMHTRRTMIGLAEKGLGGFTFFDTAQPASDRDL